MEGCSRERDGRRILGRQLLRGVKGVVASQDEPKALPGGVREIMMAARSTAISSRIYVTISDWKKPPEIPVESAAILSATRIMRRQVAIWIPVLPYQHPRNNVTEYHQYAYQQERF